MMSVEDSQSDQPTPAPILARPHLPWPPPGLEPLQGALWTLLRSFVPGALLFALPLLIAIAPEQDFWSLGPFGRSYWIPAVTSVLALLLLFEAGIRLARALRRAAAGAELGYDLGTILSVAADGSRDTGFVIQGARSYAALPPDERHYLLVLRRIGPAAYLIATLWIPVGLSLAMLLAFSGVIHGFAMWVITLLPAVLLILPALFARALESALERSAAKRGEAEYESMHQELSDEAAQWRHRRDEVLDREDQPARPPNATALRITAAAAIVPAVLLIIPVLTVLGATVMGPVLARIAMPRYTSTEGRLLADQAFDAYLAPVDSSITPQRAGEAFANISQAAGRDPGPYVRPAPQPVDSINADVPDNPLANATGWADTVATLYRSGKLSAEQRSFIRRMAGHNAHAEFATLARAPSVDFNGTRYVTPLPDSIIFFELTIPKFGGIRETAYMHTLLAFDHLLEGRPAEAERTMKEIINAGRLMSRDGVFLIEALIGSAIVGIGANGLEQLYRVSGRTADAEVIASLSKGRDLVRNAPNRGQLEFESGVKELSRMVVAPRTNRSLRWEFFAAVSMAAQCINLHNAVFPTDSEYEQWLERAHDRLVVYPADEALFDLMRRGLMGGRARPGACGIPFHRMREIVNIAGG